MSGEIFPPDVQIRTLSALSSLAAAQQGLTKRGSQTFAGTIARQCDCPLVALLRLERDHSDSKPLEISSRSHVRWRPLLSDILGSKELRGAHPVFYGSSASSPLNKKLRLSGLGGLVAVPVRDGRMLQGVLVLGTHETADGRRSNRRFLSSLAEFARLRLGSGENQTQNLRSPQSMAAMLQGVREAIVLVDRGKRTIIDANRHVSEITGYDEEEVLGRRFDRLFTGDRKKIIPRLLKQASAGSAGKFFPAELRRKDGKRVPVELSTRMLNVNGRKTVLTIARDLSERRRAEVKLTASEDLLRIIVDGTLDMFFYVHNARGVFTYVSPSIERLTGHSPEEWKTHFTKFLTANPINKKAREYTNRAMRKGIPGPVYLCEVRHADGRPVLLEINEKPIFREGKVIGIQGVARDITERKRLEEAIIESRDSLDRILDQTPMAVMVFDDRGNLADVNGAWLRLFGAVEKSQVVGKVNLFRSSFFRNTGMVDEMAKVFRGKIVDIPAITIDPRLARPEVNLSGLERSVHVRLFPVMHRDGKLANAVAMIEDVTERRRLEEQLVQSQKMESIGLLAGGIAHDFNNILGGILGYSSFVRAQVPKTEKIYDHLETIERSALRAAELTSQLLAFARGGKYVVGPILLNDLVRETAELLRGTIGKNIALETRLDVNAPVIEADASQMQQVLMNLCVNARDAMPSGGKLTITTSRLKKPDAFLASLPESLSMQYVLIEIEDTGIGIETAIRGKIFDPFFTTKEKGKGTGLGLAMVYGIVKNHGGFVNFESEVGVGTKFSIYLPSAGKKVKTAAVEDIRASGGKETILVVDDEVTIRALVKDVLEERGYSVLAASDGREAVDMFQKNSEGIDLVILDMTMPVMGGRETFIQLKEIKPSVRAILSTGYSEDDRAREVLALGVMAFVQKPYRVDDLAASVRKVLDATVSA